MCKKKDWQEEVWEIKKEIARETKDFSTDEYWRYLQSNANEFLMGVKRKKKSSHHSGN